jgi:hypothetical protein
MAPLPTPNALGPAGEALWRSIADPTDAWDLRPDELAVLGRACRVADRIALLDEQLGGDLTTTGSMGQEVEHPVLSALAKHDPLLQRLLAALKLPDLETGESSTSANARKAAQARWSKPRSA